MDDGGIGRYLLALALLIPGLFGLLCLIEFEIASPHLKPCFKSICRCCFKKKRTFAQNDKETEELEDEDVTVCLD